MARPRKEISDLKPEDAARVLASAFCTDEEIAARLEVSETTLKRRYGPALKEGRRGAKANLRALQWRHAQTSYQMAIFLGKQYLGQRDVPEISETDLMKLYERLAPMVASLADAQMEGKILSGYNEPREENEETRNEETQNEP